MTQERMVECSRGSEKDISNVRYFITFFSVTQEMSVEKLCIFDDLRDWYPYISKSSKCIPAALIPITQSTSNAILSAYSKCEKLYFQKMRECNGEINKDDIWQSILTLLSSSEKTELENFQDSLEIDPSEGSFIRLSTRSPKDCLLKPTSGNLRIFSSKEALQVLCSSERIKTDLPKHPVCVIRPWVQLIDWSEVRVFIHNGVITAASQYSPGFVFPEELRKNEKNIFDFVEALMKLFPEGSSCVADVGMTKSGNWVLIEMNPFGRQTSACLFSWVIDDKVLHDGPFCFRVVER